MKVLFLTVCFISSLAQALEPNELVKRNEASQGLVLHCQIQGGDTLTSLRFIPRAEFVEFTTNRGVGIGSYLTELRKFGETYTFVAAGEFSLDGDRMTYSIKTRNSGSNAFDARGTLRVASQYGNISYPLVCNARH